MSFRIAILHVQMCTYLMCNSKNSVALIFLTIMSCRNVVDLSTHDLKGGTLTTTTPIPAYEIMKHEREEDGQRKHEYELVGVIPGINPPEAVEKTYEMPSPTIPLSGGAVGVVKKGQEEGMYDTIP